MQIVKLLVNDIEIDEVDEVLVMLELLENDELLYSNIYYLVDIALSDEIVYGVMIDINSMHLHQIEFYALINI